MKATFWQAFWVPLVVAVALGVYLGLEKTYYLLAVIVAFAGVIVGSFQLLQETVTALRERRLALDYIAIGALALSLSTGEYVVALVIAIMLATGRSLEKYGLDKARASLTALTDRIPNEVVLWKNGQAAERVSRTTVAVGTEILVRKGEVVPLDGVLVSERALVDESSLTGEPYMNDKVGGDQVRSGTINAGDVLVLRVSKSDEDSTYRKIIALVERAQAEKAPLVRLADKYSGWFTLITVLIAGAAFFGTHSWERVLAVLVVATPCPLILATPIALFGGLNAAAKRRILVKKIASLEVLSRVTDVIFDKTGTITLGAPQVNRIEHVADVGGAANAISETEILSAAEALERNSLHPIAKAIVAAAREAQAPRLPATDVQEEIGVGIKGKIAGVWYAVRRPQHESYSQSVEVWKNDAPVARIYFTDILKEDSQLVLARLKKIHLALHLFTGDRPEPAAQMVAQLGPVGETITIRARCTPEDKKNGVAELKARGAVTAMVGDGINDAPALALADVGLVFSNEEHTAASEAADIVFLGGDVAHVTEIMEIAHRTIRIAKQSIFVGIGLSMLAMIAAALGYIPPVTGAILQEIIDVVVIFNALRASR